MVQLVGRQVVLNKNLTAILFGLLAFGCDGDSSVTSPDAASQSQEARAKTPVDQSPNAASTMDEIAQDYVHLVLAFGEHDGDYVDAYLGPPAWAEQAKQEPLTLPEIRAETERLMQAMNALPKPKLELPRLRNEAMGKRLLALLARIDLISGEPASFDEETRLLYDATAPDRDAAYFEQVLAQIDSLVPGEESLPERVEAFRQQFVIPPEKLATVFNRAIQECRRRTLEHIALPAEENFRIEYVSDKPWSGYNWYQGDFYSLIQINVDLPIYIDRAVDLGCHEGYPGHHTYNVLLEKNLVNERGWLEFSVYPLFSPTSLISEGSANYGINMAFPGDERVGFERDVLFPLAGLNPANAEQYYQLQALLQQLNYAGNEAARDYLNKQISREQAVEWLVKYNLNSPERASQRVDFFDKYRSYVINYNLGKDIVSAYVEREAEQEGSNRWRVFTRVLSAPYSPSDLAVPDE